MKLKEQKKFGILWLSIGAALFLAGLLLGETEYGSYIGGFGGDTYNKTLWEKVEDIDPRYNVDERAFTDRWKNPGDLSRYLAIKERRSTTPHNSERFVERLNELWLSSATLTYEFQPKFLKRLGFKRLAVGVGVSDIVRFSTVKYERGTSYPYCRTINLTIRPTF